MRQGGIESEKTPLPHLLGYIVRAKLERQQHGNCIDAGNVTFDLLDYYLYIIYVT